MELPKQKAFDFWLEELQEGKESKNYIHAIMWFRSYFDELLQDKLK